MFLYLAGCCRFTLVFFIAMLDRSSPHGAYWLCLIAMWSPCWLSGSHEVKDTVAPTMPNSTINDQQPEQLPAQDKCFVEFTPHQLSLSRTNAVQTPSWVFLITQLGAKTPSEDQPQSDVLSIACQHHSGQNSVPASQSTVTLLFPLTTHTMMQLV